MLSILAQTPPPAGFASFIENIAWTAITLAAVVFAWRQITGKSDETKIGPSPLVVSEHVTYATVEQHNALAAQVDQRLSALSRAGTESREKIHKEISALQVSVEGVKTQNNQQFTSLAEIKTEQAAIKLEIKQDNIAVHGRIGEVLSALGEIKGQLRSVFK